MQVSVVRPPPPSFAPVADAEIEPLAKGHDGIGFAAFEQRDYRLCDYQRDIPFQPVAQPLRLALEEIALLGEIDPYDALVDAHRKRAHVVGPLIEGTPGREVEARVMPVAGQDAILDAPAIERDAHVRASIVHREDSPARVEQRDHVAIEVDCAALSVGQVREVEGPNESRRDALVVHFKFFPAVGGEIIYKVLAFVSKSRSHLRNKIHPVG